MKCRIHAFDMTHALVCHELVCHESRNAHSRVCHKHMQCVRSLINVCHDSCIYATLHTCMCHQSLQCVRLLIYVCRDRGTCVMIHAHMPYGTCVYVCPCMCVCVCARKKNCHLLFPRRSLHSRSIYMIYKLLPTSTNTHGNDTRRTQKYVDTN